MGLGVVEVEVGMVDAVVGFDVVEVEVDKVDAVVGLDVVEVEVGRVDAVVGFDIVDCIVAFWAQTVTYSAQGTHVVRMDQPSGLFPANLTIAECRASVHNFNGFRESSKFDHIIFNYDYAFRQSFPDPTQMEDPAQARLMLVRRHVHLRFCIH